MAKVQPVEIPFEGVGTTLEVTLLPFKTSSQKVCVCVCTSEKEYCSFLI